MRDKENVMKYALQFLSKLSGCPLPPVKNWFPALCKNLDGSRETRRYHNRGKYKIHKAIGRENLQSHIMYRVYKETS
jgi:hypothetical protein